VQSQTQDRNDGRLRENNGKTQSAMTHSGVSNWEFRSQAKITAK
jgi:hypothetical protein